MVSSRSVHAVLSTGINRLLSSRIAPRSSSVASRIVGCGIAATLIRPLPRTVGGPAPAGDQPGVVEGAVAGDGAVAHSSGSVTVPGEGSMASTTIHSSRFAS